MAAGRRASLQALNSSNGSRQTQGQAGSKLGKDSLGSSREAKEQSSSSGGTREPLPSSLSLYRAQRHFPRCRAYLLPSLRALAMQRLTQHPLYPSPANNSALALQMLAALQHELGEALGDAAAELFCHALQGDDALLWLLLELQQGQEDGQGGEQLSRPEVEEAMQGLAQRVLALAALQEELALQATLHLAYLHTLLEREVMNAPMPVYMPQQQQSEEQIEEREAARGGGLQGQQQHQQELQAWTSHAVLDPVSPSPFRVSSRENSLPRAQGTGPQSPMASSPAAAQQQQPYEYSLQRSASAQGSGAKVPRYMMQSQASASKIRPAGGKSSSRRFQE